MMQNRKSDKRNCKNSSTQPQGGLLDSRD